MRTDFFIRVCSDRTRVMVLHWKRIHSDKIKGRNILRGGDEALEQVAQRCGGCPIPENIWGQVGQGSSNLFQLKTPFLTACDANIGAESSKCWNGQKQGSHAAGWNLFKIQLGSDNKNLFFWTVWAAVTAAYIHKHQPIAARGHDGIWNRAENQGSISLFMGMCLFGWWIENEPVDFAGFPQVDW